MNGQEKENKQTNQPQSPTVWRVWERNQLCVSGFFFHRIFPGLGKVLSRSRLGYVSQEARDLTCRCSRLVASCTARADSRGVRCTRWGYRENRTTSEQKSLLCVLKECARLSSLILAITVPWEVKARCEITGTGSLHRRSVCWKNLFYSFFVFLNLQQNRKVLHAVFTRARGRQQQLPVVSQGGFRHVLLLTLSFIICCGRGGMR